MADARVAQVRSFSRVVTQRVGALDDRFLARNRPLAQSRVLWEIGIEGCQVRLLRSRLGLDSGHLSRLLRALEAEGLVCLAPGRGDRRIRVARLTRAGLSERKLLDRRSDELAASILAQLEPRRQGELVAAMRTVERLLTAAVLEIRTVDPEHRDAVHCVEAYFAELDRRSHSGFDRSTSIAVDRDEVTGPAGALLISYLRGEAIGCGAVRHRPGEPSEIKRMWVAEPARGLGVGGRLLAELEARARESGATDTRLDTNHVLVEAIAMYRSAGYVEVPPFTGEPFADHWFEKRLSP